MDIFRDKLVECIRSIQNSLREVNLCTLKKFKREILLKITTNTKTWRKTDGVSTRRQTDSDNQITCINYLIVIFNYFLIKSEFEVVRIRRSRKLEFLNDTKNNDLKQIVIPSLYDSCVVKILKDDIFPQNY